jgi:hypothetical protein
MKFVEFIMFIKVLAFVDLKSPALYYSRFLHETQGAFNVLYILTYPSECNNCTLVKPIIRA